MVGHDIAEILLKVAQTNQNSTLLTFYFYQSFKHLVLSLLVIVKDFSHPFPSRN